MPWQIDRDADGLPERMYWTQGTVEYADGSRREVTTRVYPRHVLAAVAEDERTIRAAFPGREPAAAQVAELCGLSKVEVEQIWEQVGRAKP